MRRFVKRNAGAPEGFFACEAAGLAWLAAAESGVPCVRVLDHDATTLTLEHRDVVQPDRASAYEFGRRLADTHAAGAPSFGAGPEGWSGPGFFGPMSQPLPMALTGHAAWGEFYADERLAPLGERAAPRLDAEVRRDLDEVLRRCRRGDYDDGAPPARLHGDLWSGNVLWTREGAVLIDPAAHGGHGETDLAMLELFGCPHREAVLEGYRGRRRLRSGWEMRIGLHQLYPLLAHVVLFGSSYVFSTAAAISSALAIES